ncbi:MAG: 30S ribosomal protein S8 [Thermoguttaceae bacterium]
MMMTDPIADMLTRIRNAVRVEKETLDVPYSKVKEGVVDVLKREGFIWDYTVLEDEPRNVIRIQLKYSISGERAIKSIRRISSPGRRMYVRSKNLRPVLNGLGIYVLSTNRGVMSDREAREQNVGGEILCEIW